MMFRKETEFQETEIGKIPKDWKIEKLSSLATIIMGQSPPSSTYNKEGKGLPFIQGKMEFGKMYPSPTTYTSRPLKIAEKGDVLMSVRAPVGDVNIAPYKLCIGRGLAAIRFNSKTANNLFYFYYLQSIKSRLESLGKGSTFKAITKKDLEELRIVYPPLNEQKGIADVLLMVDRGIEIVDRAVAKLERMKSALLNELLTGRIRVREENNKLTFYKKTEFKDTEIGKIPKDWYVKRLKEVADFQRGFSYRSDEKFTEEVPDGYLFLTLNSVKEGGGLKEDGWTWIKSDRLGERHFIREGDLVIANTEQSKDGSLIGSPAIVHFPKWYKKDKAVFSHHISRLLLKINNIDVNFLFYYLSFVQPLARKYHTGTGVWGLDVDKWGTDLLIPLPPIKEQTAIAEILSTVDKAIELYRKEEEKLLRLRRGLMSVLLTGRVRVVSDVRDVGVIV